MRAATLCVLALCVATCHARQLYAAEGELGWGRPGSRARQGPPPLLSGGAAARRPLFPLSFPFSSPYHSLFPGDPANPAALCDPVTNTTIEPPANSYPVFSLLGAHAACVCRLAWLEFGRVWGGWRT